MVTRFLGSCDPVGEAHVEIGMYSKNTWLLYEPIRIAKTLRDDRMIQRDARVTVEDTFPMVVPHNPNAGELVFFDDLAIGVNEDTGKLSIRVWQR